MPNLAQFRLYILVSLRTRDLYSNDKIKDLNRRTLSRLLLVPETPDPLPPLGPAQARGSTCYWDRQVRTGTICGLTGYCSDEAD